MQRQINHDPYLDQASGLLKNKYGITDADQLETTEGDATAFRSYQLQETPLEGNFDLKHLQAIHQHLFGDVYEWAGELRTVDISKGREKFARPDFIEREGASLFRKLAAEKHLAGLNPAEFSSRAAHYMGEIHTLHPFREGNSRTLREFVSHLGQQNDYYIAWEKVTHQETQQGCFDAFQGDATKLAALIGSNLHTFERVEPTPTKEPETSSPPELSSAFVQGMSDLAAQRGAQTERGQDLDSGLDR